MLRSDGRPLWPDLAKTVLKSDPRVEPEAWIEASPVRIATDRRPPFFVIHGGADSLVSPDMSRRLVSALRDAGGPPVGYLEVPGANHGFDFFAGVRGRATAIGVADVLSHLHARDRVT